MTNKMKPFWRGVTWAVVMALDIRLWMLIYVAFADGQMAREPWRLVAPVINIIISLVLLASLYNEINEACTGD